MSSITNSNSLTVGVALDGAGWHPAAWREDAAEPEQLFTAPYWQRLVVAADKAGIDYVTLEDGLRPPTPGEAPQNIVHGRLDAVMVASWVAPHTTHIGIVPTVTTTHTEPFHVATGLQTLDHISEGRAGWQVRISTTQAEAAAFGRKQAPVTGISETLINEAADTVEVARRLWDSWEDDAIIRDAVTGRFLDRDRVHHINFAGDQFSVIGPSIVPRSPQGQLPVSLLAHTPQVMTLAARVADVIYITPESAAPQAEDSRGHTASELVQLVREAEAATGRDARTPLKVVADLVVVLDTEVESASDRLDRLNRAANHAFVSDARILAGSAEDVADLIEQWLVAGIDGIRLRPATLPDDLVSIGRDLMPVLRQRGLASEPPAHSSLRERLALPEATNRYADTTNTHRLEATEVAR